MILRLGAMGIQTWNNELVFQHVRGEGENQHLDFTNKKNFDLRDTHIQARQAILCAI